MLDRSVIGITASPSPAWARGNAGTNLPTGVESREASGLRRLQRRFACWRPSSRGAPTVLTSRIGTKTLCVFRVSAVSGTPVQPQRRERRRAVFSRISRVAQSASYEWLLHLGHHSRRVVVGESHLRGARHCFGLARRRSPVLGRYRSGDCDIGDGVHGASPAHHLLSNRKRSRMEH